MGRTHHLGTALDLVGLATDATTAYTGWSSLEQRKALRLAARAAALAEADAE
jgi:hypothetical protein